VTPNIIIKQRPRGCEKTDPEIEGCGNYTFAEACTKLLREHSYEEDALVLHYKQVCKKETSKEVEKKTNLGKACIGKARDVKIKTPARLGSGDGFLSELGERREDAGELGGGLLW
jgi:hypothetical protein